MIAPRDTRLLEAIHARHEAIHAVTAVLLGACSVTARLYRRPNRQDNRGETRFRINDDTDAQIIAAAPMALMVLGAPSRFCGRTNLKLLRDHGYDKDLDGVKAGRLPGLVRAARLLLRPHVRTIDAVADALRQRRRLSDRQVRRFVLRVNQLGGGR